MDHQGFAPSDLRIYSTPDSFISAFLKKIKRKKIYYNKNFSLDSKNKNIFKKGLTLNDIAFNLRKFTNPKKSVFIKITRWVAFFRMAFN